MAIWQPFKAPAKDRQRNIKYRAKDDKKPACRICGKPTEGGKICRSCKEFINIMQEKERGVL